ncbi:riboflavin biosynthesis protein [Musa troglodytarum]|uniref:3,4-dihydroxy-2-butanone-4-phosphate synthase n=1 Tax=Musa troglodytarum TaxID=320322 RepID=A0A9E7GM40_9LILI|nr:riboflavin biosynthesis protein [Musa troglodytarum]URE17350.1 riboflavin biosynthesis protein [Musa troglodytarum]
MASVASSSSSSALVFLCPRVHCVSGGSSSFKEFRGFYHSAFAVNQRTWSGFRKAACLALNAAVQRSSEGNMLLGQSTIIEQGCLTANAMLQEDAVAHGTIASDMAPAVDEFSIGNGELDLDCPTEGFSPISEAIEDIRRGKFVIVVDDESRENEGDLIMAAPLVTPEAMAFTVKHGTGIVCVSMKTEDLERLERPLTVSNKENEEKLCAAFTVSVDAKEGTTTGVSARDRAKTVQMPASADSNPEDFNRPGHIFPLKYREGGVLRRAGHHLLLELRVRSLMKMAPWLGCQSYVSLQRKRI